LGGALPDEVGEEPGSTEDRDDLDRILADSVDDAERPNNELAELWVATLGDDATRLWELLEAVWSSGESLHNEIRIQGRVLSDVLVNRL